MSQTNSFFSAVAGPPRPLGIDHLFGGSQAGYSYTSGSSTSELLQQLMAQLNDQTSILNELVGTLSGKSSGSALDSLLGGASFGGSALGGIASAAKSGFSWQSVLSDIFPVGGLISGIASLFDSAPAPPPLNEYAAPPSLNFNAVLNANGTLSEGSTNQYGYTRASEQGLDLTDAEGGPYSPYARASNGSLVPVAGDPTTLYSGTLNLPEMLQGVISGSPVVPWSASSPGSATWPVSSAAPGSTVAGSTVLDSTAVPGSTTVRGATVPGPTATPGFKAPLGSKAVWRSTPGAPGTPTATNNGSLLNAASLVQLTGTGSATAGRQIAGLPENARTQTAGGLDLSQLLQTVISGSSLDGATPLTNTGPSNIPGAAANASAPAQGSAGAVASSTNNDTGRDGSNTLPSFDQQWFNDHGSQIASAVRAQLLNYHPIVDTINDL